MYKLKKSIGYRIVSIFLAAAFLLSDLSLAYPIQQPSQPHALAVPSVFQTKALNSEAIFVDSILSVGKYLLGDPGNNVKPLPLRYLEYVMDTELKEGISAIDLSHVRVEEGVAIIPCVRNGKQCVIQIALKNTPSSKSIKGESLDISDLYDIKILDLAKTSQQISPPLSPAPIKVSDSSIQQRTDQSPATLSSSVNNLFDPVYGERMYQSVPHIVTVAIIASSLERIRATLEFIKQEQARSPPHHIITPILVDFIGRENKLDNITLQSLSDEIGIKCEIVNSDVNDYSDLLFTLRDKAYYEYGATILNVISDQTSYQPGDLCKNIKSLIYYRKPSVIVSSVQNESDDKSVINPVDFTFYTDAYFARERQFGKSFLDQIASHLILNNNENNENRVSVVAPQNIEFRKIALWSKSSYNTYPLAPVDESSGVDFLPRDEEILFFEPHPDDYVLAGASILKNLLIRGNKIDVLGITSESENDHWPKEEDARVKENLEAFNNIYELAIGANADVRSINYTTHTFNRKNSSQPNLVLVQDEIEKIAKYLESLRPTIIVVPAAEDTHRHHVRMRELALKAAQLYVKKTGRSLKVFSVPLFSAEETAYSKTNRFIFQDERNCSDKRHVLDIFKFQQEYVAGELYQERHGRGIQRTKETLEALKKNGYAIPEGVVETESFVEEVLPDKITQKQELILKTSGHDSFRLTMKAEDELYSIDYIKGMPGLKISAFNTTLQKVIPIDVKVLDMISELLLEEICSRDKSRSNVLDRRILTDGIYHNPLDWIVDVLFNANKLENISSEDQNVVVSLKVLFEKLVGEIEEMKLKNGVLQKATSPADKSLYESRSKENQKLVIGIAAHKSADMISERLKNIFEQIKDFPSEWRHWAIEIVLCVNGKPEEVNNMADEAIEQIPKNIFEGVTNPVKIVVLKERYANQPNALKAIHKYAEARKATMLSITDDDVNYDRYALNRMISTLIATKERCVVGARFYWRRRPHEALYQEAIDELSQGLMTRKLPSRVLKILANIKLPLKILWQEVAIFRRRPDIPFAPKVIMGAASVGWVDNFKSIPYWIRQGDVWQRYRYAPYAILAEGAFASSLAARTLSYYLNKRARTFYGYRNDINTIFSEQRRVIQDDGDVYYYKHLREAGITSLVLKDGILLLLSISVYEFSERLYRYFGFIFNRPRFFWSLAERGAEIKKIPASQSLVDYDTTSSSEEWERLTIVPDGITFYYANRKQQGSYYIYNRETQKSVEYFKKELLQNLESARTDKMGLPIFLPQQISQLAYLLYRMENSKLPIDFTRKVILVFCDLYSAPDIHASEIMSHHNIDKDGILAIFGFIRDSVVLQELFMKHPMHRNFFDKMKGLLSTPEQIQKMINLETTFPLAIEMHPSTACDSRCEFCYNKGHWFYEEKNSGRKPLTADDWARLVDESADNGLKKVYALGGLEPLMAPDETIAILNRAKERGLESAIFTNGISIDSSNTRLIDALLGTGSIFISLRAMDATTYAKITRTKEFDHVIENIRYLVGGRKKRGSKVSIGIAYFVTPDNFKEIPALFDFAKNEGIDIVGLSSDNTAELPGFTGKERSELKMIMRKLVTDVDKGRYEKVKLNVNDTLLAMAYPDDAIPQIYKYNLRKADECQTLYLKSAINPFGTVFNCCLLAHPGFTALVDPVGQITDGHSLTDIMQENQKKIHNATKCPSCNPSEKNGLIAFAKIKDDYEAGIPLNAQPFKSKVSAESPWMKLVSQRKPVKELEVHVAEPRYAPSDLSEIVESSVNNERAKFIKFGNKVINSLVTNTASENAIDISTIDKKMATAEIRQRVERAIAIIDGLEKEKVSPEMKGNIESLKKNLNQFEADGAVGSLIVLARRAQRENQKLIIGLETDWIPGINVKNSLQRQAITALMKEIDSIAEALQSMGLDNVEVVRGVGSQLAGAILNEAEKTHTKMHNIIVMASANTINSNGFASLRNADESDRPFLTGIDPTELIKLYTEFGESVSKQLYVRLASLLYMTLELAAGKEPPQSPIIVSYDKKLRILILLPKADPIDYEVLKSNYAAEKTAMQAA